MRVKDKIAVVTGGGSGLGWAISERFAAEGATVIIADINRESGEAAVQKLLARGAKAAAFVVDVSKREQVRDFAKQVIGQFGRIDILVNNAGITRHAPFLQIADDTWDLVVGVDLKGVFYCAQAFAPFFVEQRAGKIVNISSISGTGASSHAAGGSPAGNSVYASAKAGVVQLTKTLARELGPSGVHVNCVAPGFFLTPMTGTTRSPKEVEEHVAARAGMAVLGRPGKVAELAAAVLFFASDDASFVTGQTLYVDGGRTDRM
jgi:NAD(P)-dependent dehydrogenase (short-subunit alcohol dehydrogenase family)